MINIYLSHWCLWNKGALNHFVDPGLENTAKRHNLSETLKRSQNATPDLASHNPQIYMYLWWSVGPCSQVAIFFKICQCIQQGEYLPAGTDNIRLYFLAHKNAYFLHLGWFFYLFSGSGPSLCRGPLLTESRVRYKLARLHNNSCVNSLLLHGFLFLVCVVCDRDPPNSEIHVCCQPKIEEKIYQVSKTPTHVYITDNSAHNIYWKFWLLISSRGSKCTTVTQLFVTIL